MEESVKILNAGKKDRFDTEKKNPLTLDLF